MATAPALRGVCRAERATRAGIAAYCTPRNRVKLVFVEGRNNKIPVIQRRVFDSQDEEYDRFKILPACLPRK
jgi:transposase